MSCSARKSGQQTRDEWRRPLVARYAVDGVHTVSNIQRKRRSGACACACACPAQSVCKVCVRAARV